MLEAKFIDVEGYRVRYWEAGEGFPVLFVHGVGPGTSCIGNFEPVLEPMAARYRVIAIDLIGFGDSERKGDAPYFDLDLWVRQGVAVLDALAPDGACGVAGHSLGGALALKIASRCSRVTHVLTSSSIGASYPLNHTLDEFWSLPANPARLRSVMESMVYDPATIGDEMLDGRWSLLTQDGYGAYFEDMFAGDRQRYIDSAVVGEKEFAGISAEITMIHGRDDRPCPPDQTTLALAPRLPAADVILLGRCGHNLPREQTEKYLAAAFALFGA